MRKWLLLFAILIWSCEAEPTISKPIVKEEIVEEIVVEPVVIEEEKIEALVKLTNNEMRIIAIEDLHALMSKTLIERVDFNEAIEAQQDLIENIIYEVVMNYRRDMVDKIILKENVDLTSEEKALLIERTTYQEMYQLMLTYEMVFLKHYEQ
ncbi:MAG: hypothetical protein JXR88_08425 [Clostridia bacterium]|nr:hypothetical protein [Clostridia bacterium]